MYIISHTENMQLVKLQNLVLVGQQNTQQIGNIAYDKCFVLQYKAKQTFPILLQLFIVQS